MKDITHEIAEHIQSTTTQRKELAKNLRQSNPELIQQVQNQDLNNLKVCGVDGGFLKKEFQGMTLLLRRAVGVCFEYKNNQVNAQYLPNKNPTPEPIVIPPNFSEPDTTTLANLKRVELEISTAIKSVETFKPDIMVLDGSIVVYPSSIPEKNSVAYETYKQVIMLFRQLYELCTKEQVLLVGANEDSRGRKFCQILKKQLLKDKPESAVLDTTNDTTFLYHLLNDCEKTVPFSYSENEDVPSLADLGEWKNKIYALYLKPCKFDRPLRLDFLATQNPQVNADKISAIIHAISYQNRTYAYPSVLIEADARAKLSEKDLAVFKKALFEKIGNDPTIFDLRRETRPI
jgi:hypothetical protein